MADWERPAEAERGLRLSVVIPVRDDSALLAGALAALRAQTRQPDEIVVVDSASADDSGEVARRAGAVVVTESVPGIPRATARGFDTATGDILLRIDADSRPPASWGEQLERHFVADPAPAAVQLPRRMRRAPRPPAWGGDWLGRLFAAAPALAGFTGPGRFSGAPFLRRALGRGLYRGGFSRVVRVVVGHPPLFGSNFAL